MIAWGVTLINGHICDYWLCAVICMKHDFQFSRYECETSVSQYFILSHVILKHIQPLPLLFIKYSLPLCNTFILECGPWITHVTHWLEKKNNLEHLITSEEHSCLIIKLKELSVRLSWKRLPKIVFIYYNNMV
jgi:hypothetical protein